MTPLILLAAVLAAPPAPERPTFASIASRLKYGIQLTTATGQDAMVLQCVFAEAPSGSGLVCNGTKYVVRLPKAAGAAAGSRPRLPSDPSARKKLADELQARACQTSTGGPKQRRAMKDLCDCADEACVFDRAEAAMAISEAACTVSRFQGVAFLFPATPKAHTASTTTAAAFCNWNETTTLEVDGDGKLILRVEQELTGKPLCGRGGKTEYRETELVVLSDCSETILRP